MPIADSRLGDRSDGAGVDAESLGAAECETDSERAERGRRQHELVSCCAIAALATTFFLEKCERH